MPKPLGWFKLTQGPLRACSARADGAGGIDGRKWRGGGSAWRAAASLTLLILPSSAGLVIKM